MNISETNFEVGLIFYQIMATMFKVHNSLVTQLLSFGQLLCFEKHRPMPSRINVDIM